MSELSNWETLPSFDFCTINSPPSIGVRVEDRILIVNQKNRSTYRIHPCNFGNLKQVALLKSKRDLPNSEIIKKYFEDNLDNPYAVQSFIELLVLQEDLTHPTQLPPLNFPKTELEQANGIERIKELSKPGDIIFTFDRNSIIHNIIRYVDFGHWAHCGTISPSGTLLEMVRTGGQEVHLDSLKNRGLDVGLYRVKNISEKDGYRMAQGAEKLMKKNLKYNFRGIIKIFLRKVCKLKFIQHPPTPKSLIVSQALELIYYA